MSRELPRGVLRIHLDGVATAVLVMLVIPVLQVIVMSSAGGPTAAQEPPVTTPDPPCFNNLDRYVDCGNGTVTDSVTGLIWLQDAACFGATDWASGSTLVAGLAHGQCGLADASQSGQWRLPTIDEWQATIAPAVAMGCSLDGTGIPPALTNAAGTACIGVGSSMFYGVVTGGYWSMTANRQHPNNAWVASLAGTIHGFLYGGVKGRPLQVWPVRAQ